MGILNQKFETREERINHYAFLFFITALVLSGLFVIGMLFAF